VLNYYQLAFELTVNIYWQEALVWWLRQMAHDQEFVGSNPGTVYCTDISNYIEEI
jgi:hypothetical protein